mgnify:CR=1 FL=1
MKGEKIMIKLENVSFSYDELQVLKDFNRKIVELADKLGKPVKIYKLI